jgi:hypothetical protein
MARRFGRAMLAARRRMILADNRMMPVSTLPRSSPPSMPMPLLRAAGIGARMRAA